MRKLSRRRSGGQALAEVALVAPLFFLMVFGIIDLARVIWANDVSAGAAREGARYASVHVGTPGLTVPATKDEIRAHTTDYVIAGGLNVTVTVCFSAVHIASGQAGCTGDVDEKVGGEDVAYARGNLVTVTVTSHVPTFIRSLFGNGDWAVSGESTVQINN
jgi:Flp pilus assembly protein TadG